MYGKSIMSWNVSSVSGGDPKKFTRLLVDCGFEAVLLKAADGIRVHVPSVNPGFGENIKQELVDELKANKIKVILWSFVYGADPRGELDIAIKQTKRFEPDGFVWDVEGAFDGRLNAESNARLISRGFKAACPEVKQSLCWWALPKSPTNGTEWHPIRVAKAWLEIVDTAMPMIYWQGSGSVNAISYLHKSLSIWRSFTDKPIAPVGRVYNGDGGVTTPESIKAFANSVYNSAASLNLIGNSWWSLDKAIDNSQWLEALKQTPKFSTSAVLPVDEILKRLMEHHSSLFPEVYPPN